MYGPVVEQGIWIIRTSHKFQDLCNDLDIAADSQKKRMKWIGHPVRMNLGRVVKKIF